MTKPNISRKEVARIHTGVDPWYDSTHIILAEDLLAAYVEIDRLRSENNNMSWELDPESMGR